MATDPHVSAEHVPHVHAIFRRHGYSGDLIVVDDSLDEAIFLVPPGARAAIEVRALETELQDLLHRKVWVTEMSDPWAGQGRSFE
jgi:hypothetical protein